MKKLIIILLFIQLTILSCTENVNNKEMKRNSELTEVTPEVDDPNKLLDKSTNNVSNNYIKNLDDIKDLFNNGNLQYYDLSVFDDAISAKLKLENHNKIIMYGVDFIGVEVLYPKDQILEENINLDFLLKIYENELYFFKKFRITNDELKLLINHFKESGTSEIIGSYTKYYIENKELLFRLSVRKQKGDLVIINKKYKVIIEKKYKEEDEI